jgi:4'-phosphopantetheinyl transferase
VGVDLEQVRPDRDVMGLGARFFSPAEAAVLVALPPGARVEAFYNGWTRKEAYVKARGDGLWLPLDWFDVSLTPAAPAALLRSARGPAEVRRWDVFGFVPAPGYVAALVVASGVARVVGWILEIPHRPSSPQRT